MNSKPNRREFLKWISLLSLSGLYSHFFPPNSLPLSVDNGGNVIMLVFDTLSALHLDLHGYQRKTTPNLARFAENATVYHSHYSAGNFTVPGTASMLTGTYPWTNLAYHFHGTIQDDFATKNIFQILKENGYTSLAFSHNIQVNMLFSQFQHSIETWKMPRDVPLSDNNLSDLLFRRDYGAAIRSEAVYLKFAGELPNSLFLDPIGWLFRVKSTEAINNELWQLFPRGVPKSDDIVCVLEDTFDWLIPQLMALPQPYFAYIHVMPPHFPYNTRREFIDIFNDGWEPASKPESIFARRKLPTSIYELRRFYDEYIAYVDSEFGRIFNQLLQKGVLENTHLIITSDHGEMFERGVWGHLNQVLYQPVIRVPLLIHEPGQNFRQDIYTLTSSIDLVPTILHLAQLGCPSWCEGEILPPYAENSSTDERTIFAVEAKSNPKSRQLEVATVAMMKDQYKLINYMGYPDSEDFFELFDLSNDPDERLDLSEVRKPLASDLLEELRTKIQEK
jgi:arylsulfatase A-like enzyme